MGQAFQLISGPGLNDLLTESENRLSRLLKSGKSPEAIIDELYWTALSRAPTATELQQCAKRLREAKDQRRELEDLTWALLNAKEFVLRR
jgi:hypothetical protein